MKDKRYIIFYYSLLLAITYGPYMDDFSYSDKSRTLIQGPLIPCLFENYFFELHTAIFYFRSDDSFRQFYDSFFQAQSFRMVSNIFSSVMRDLDSKKDSHFPHSNRIFFYVSPTFVQDQDYFSRQHH